MNGGEKGAGVVSPAGLIAFHAARHPHAPAMLAPGRATMTFGALDQMIASTAGQLADLGIGRGHRVALVLPDGPEMAAALFAVTETATCAPIAPATDERACLALFPRMRIDAIIVPHDHDLPARRAATALGTQVLSLSPRRVAPRYALGDYAATASKQGGRMTMFGEAGTAPAVPEMERAGIRSSGQPEAIDRLMRSALPDRIMAGPREFAIGELPILL
jgi:non-ribosomal peptide synthetase component E (peptide arylation enzyme)